MPLLLNAPRNALTMQLLPNCNYITAGLVSYDTPTPEVSQNQESGEQPIMFSDDSYDGEETESWFTQGLGQLSDGVKGNGDLSKVSFWILISRGGFKIILSKWLKKELFHIFAWLFVAYRVTC